MFDLFAAAPKDLRDAKLREYGDYLVERDGEMNLKERTLSKREVMIANYETPPTVARELDRDEFRRRYVAFDKRNPPSPEMMLLLALIKANSSEAYGVSRTIQGAMARALKTNDDAELRILCEEGYHTRILLSSANRYGIEVSDPYVPPTALRILIGGIATTPIALSRPLILASEILGTLVFLKLFEVTRRVLKHDPETRDALEQRLLEICTDERGHITFNRMHSGPAVLAQARLILPLLARSMEGILPEVVALGAFPHNVLQELPLLSDTKRLPASVWRQSFIA